jgi:hypothetical protein
MMLNLPADQLVDDARILAIQDGFAVVDHDVLAFDITEFGQSLSKYVKSFWIGILGGHVAQNRHGLSEAPGNRQRQQPRCTKTAYSAPGEYRHITPPLREDSRPKGDQVMQFNEAGSKRRCMAATGASRGSIGRRAWI